MGQPIQTMLEGLDFGPPPTKEDVWKVIEELSHPCFACELGPQDHHNPGLIYRGNPLARFAFVSEMPGDSEWREHKAMVGRAGKEFEFWWKHKLHINIDTEAFVINVVQCRTPKVTKKTNGVTKTTPRSPRPSELRKCFPSRCFRVLKAMPNLECIIALGLVAAEQLLKEEAHEKKHTGNWTQLSSFPGVFMYVLPHPAALLHTPTQYKINRTEKQLKQFVLEWPKVEKLIQEAKRASGK